MIYLEPSTLGWRPIVKSWIQQFGPAMQKEGAEVMNALFEWLVDPSIEFVRKNCKVSCPEVIMCYVPNTAKRLKLTSVHKYVNMHSCMQCKLS